MLYKEISQDTQLANLYDHYKDILFIQLADTKHRNKLSYAILLITLLLSPFPASGWIDVNSTIAEWLKRTFDIIIPVNSTFISTLLWALLLLVVLSYFQLASRINRNYLYLHNLEKVLKKFYPDQENIFEYTGKHYRIHKNCLTKFVKFFYECLFPISLIIVSAIRLYHEYTLIPNTGIFIMHTVCFILILVLVFICVCNVNRLNQFGIYLMQLFIKIKSLIKIALMS